MRAASPETRPGRPRRAYRTRDGWASKRNGELLRLAEHEFDVFLTVDRKLPHQQNLSTFRIAIIVMLARTNTLLDLRPLIPDVLQTLLTVKPGQAVVVGE